MAVLNIAVVSPCWSAKRRSLVWPLIVMGTRLPAAYPLRDNPMSCAACGALSEWQANSVCSTSPPELSSNPSLASILIPAHARNQAAASTPTNATAASGENTRLPASPAPWHHPLWRPRVSRKGWTGFSSPAFCSVSAHGHLDVAVVANPHPNLGHRYVCWCLLPRLSL